MRFFVAVFGVFARSSGGDTPQPFGWSSLGVPLIRIGKRRSAVSRSIFSDWPRIRFAREPGRKINRDSPSTNEKRCFARSGRRGKGFSLD